MMFSNLEVALLAAWLEGNDPVAQDIASMLDPYVIYKLPKKYLESITPFPDIDVFNYIVEIISEKVRLELARHPKLNRNISSN
ncbi:hypothetical protein M0C34_17920 [Agarivorans sp. TSD2052]|uniref:hypothetical protein n=1 Tax=Agarivorans sp. TSD2052 TaxID=2937286 RepID=UPI00200BAE7D|nr:hypothetical protein [Agarivorans sp. TSD2052]UPW18079.1 hypothetical protein M0C34_17920 [Agarivorans sp. TSD2052]